ncbi:ABC transporter ATP-binding protein [uncultured Alistipes sp.]|uniref:ATP-binding cassette domain-containing protein n=1 Tax=uncultured Alistipes sp. TaxID=538949 RepID=UPI002619E992|nr:ABC transporter ATP-binding protein [uncultured Alistipes sp.]
MRKILDILPAGFRRRSFGVVATLFARAALDFAGLAALLPLLMLALDPAALSGEGASPGAWIRSGSASPRLLAGMICAAVLLFTALKARISLRLFRIERNFLCDLYRTLSRRLYTAYHDRGMAFIDASDPATLVRNIQVVTQTFTCGVLRPAASILAEGMLLLLLLTALALHAPLAAAFVTALFLSVGGTYGRFVRRRFDRIGAAEHRAQRDKARIVAETFRGYADMEVNGAFPEMLREFDRALDEVVRARAQEAATNRMPALFVEGGLAVGLVLLVLVGFGKGATALRFGVFAVAALRLMPSIRSLLTAWTLLRRNRYTMAILRRAASGIAEARVRNSGNSECSGKENGRSGEGIDNRVGTSGADGKVRVIARGTPREKIDGDGETGVLPFEHEITLRGLSFRYPGGPEVIRRLDFTIRKGERIGIRGASGIGKSTLFQLLLGLYEPTEGEIRIDGVLLTPATRRLWQNRIGYVPQRPFLRNGTLAENVAPGLPSEEIDRQRVREALERAQAGAFVASLPRGIDTPVGACGSRISGGQRQRIAIARALYRQSDVLFLDEATAALDDRTEEALLRSLDDLAREHPGWTLLMIAHRAHSLIHCRRILDLGNGD